MTSELEVLLGLAKQPESEPATPPERDENGRFAPRKAMPKTVQWRSEFPICTKCHTTFKRRRYANLEYREYRVCAECTAREVNRQIRVRAAIFKAATRGRLDH